jgi:hypothetical protein
MKLSLLHSAMSAIFREKSWLREDVGNIPNAESSRESFNL